MNKILLSISMLALAYTASANVPVIKSDPKIEAQVEQTLKKLTLEEKIGQMMELVTDLSIQLLKEQWGLLLVGDGYTVKKVTIE